LSSSVDHNASVSQANAANLKDEISPTNRSNPQSAVFVSETYSTEKMLLQYSNSDGDTLSLSVQSMDYQKAILAANSDTSADSWKKIIASIKDEYIKMKGAIVDALTGNKNEQDGGPSASAALKDPRAFDETKAIPGLPDYWSADKTAQRIVDFATSFLSQFTGSSDKFVGMIKNAIDKGFSQAKDIFGNMPSAIDSLTAKTHALVMDKIDQWAKEQGSVSSNSTDQQTSSEAA
jgi:hypothetical protein